MQTAVHWDILMAVLLSVKLKAFTENQILMDRMYQATAVPVVGAGFGNAP